MNIIHITEDEGDRRAEEGEFVHQDGLPFPAGAWVAVNCEGQDDEWWEGLTTFQNGTGSWTEWVEIYRAKKEG